MHRQWEQISTVRPGGLVEVVVPELAEGQVVKVSVSTDNAAPSLEEFFAACGNVDIDEAAVEQRVPSVMVLHD